jgi:parvulin-like peptidyl-prolyl isomerase
MGEEAVHQAYLEPALVLVALFLRGLNMAFPWQRSDNPTQVAPERRRRRDRRRNLRPSSEESRRQSARLQEERRRQRLAITIGGMLILIIFAIVAVGYYREFYEPPRVMAGEIRGVEFTMGDLVERIRVLQGIERYRGGRVDLSVIPFQYLQDLLNAEILRQAAPGLGLRITPENIDTAIKDRFYPTPPAGQETDPGQLDREFENNYQTFLTQVRLSEEEYRTLVEEQLLEAQLTSLLAGNIPEKPKAVEVEWIRLEHGGGVVPQEVRDRLTRGEDFAVVAAEVGQPVGFADQNGYVGWVPEGAFPDLDETLFGNEEEKVEPLAVGEISDPISTQDGVYIVRKKSEAQEHELTDLMRRKLNLQMVENWKNEQLTRGSDEGWLKINFDSDRYAWVADQVRLTAPRIDEPQQPNQGQPPIPGNR